MRLAGKVAVVTGAGQGMGRAIARLFQAEGAKVAGFDVHLAAVQETLGDDGLALDVNIADSAAVNAAFDQVVATWGGVDVLVNVAGIGGMDTFPDVPDEAWKRVLA